MVPVRADLKAERAIGPRSRRVRGDRFESRYIEHGIIVSATDFQWPSRPLALVCLDPAQQDLLLISGPSRRSPEAGGDTLRLADLLDRALARET